MSAVLGTACALIMGLFMAAPVRAASLDAAGTKIVAFADTHQSPYSGTLPFELTTLRTLYCAGRGDRGGRLSLAAALSVARSLVNADSHGRGVRAFARSSAGRSERRAMAAAAGSLGDGRPAAALSALLRAHDLAPRDPVPLIDAAPLLTQAGKGRAALALLDAAGRLKAPRTQPFGISWKSVALANRGQALIAAHQFGAAEKTLNAALKAAPLLREARQNLAVVLSCEGKQAKAQQAMFLAVRRQTFAKGDYVGVSTSNPFGQLNQAEVLDTSKGQTLTLPTLLFPKTMQDGEAQRDANFALQHDIVWNQETALNQQLAADNQALSAQLQKANPATAQRTRDILGAVSGAGGEPDLMALSAKAGKLQDDMSALQLQGEGQAGCINAGLHGQWLSDVQAYDTAQRAYAVAVYRRQTAFAANLRSPLAHKVALEQAQLAAAQNFFLNVAELGFLDSYDSVCDPTHPDTSAPVDSGSTQTPPSPPCPSGIIGPDFSVNLLVFSFSVTCEEVTTELEVGEGWLNGFVSVSHNFTKGSNTIYAGAQAGVKVSTGPLSGGATARGGIYATFGANGAVQDVGLRGTTSAAASVGPGSASVSGPEASISLVGMFSSPY